MSNQQIVDAAEILEEVRGEVTPMLASNGQSFDRLRTVFMVAVQQNSDILLCTRDSLQREIKKCAVDGLVPDSKEAVILPYKGEAQYQPMVQGIIKRMKELGDVFSITCNLVYELDTYEENEADIESLVHKSPGFGKPRGPILGGYVIFRDAARRVMHFEKMTMEDFEKVRQASKSPNSPAWNKWPQEMYRKAVLRRGSKYISINNDKIRQLIERTDEFYDFTPSRQVERLDPFTGQVIEAAGQQSAITDQSGEARVPVDSGQSREKEPVTAEKQRDSGQGQRRTVSETKAPRNQTQQKADLPDIVPSVPDVMIQTEDKDVIVEGCTKILAISLDAAIAPVDRRGVLKQASGQWKSSFPEYAHGLLKACIDTADWAIRKDAKGEPWTADHATFVHKVKTLLGVEKLNVGKYP